MLKSLHVSRLGNGITVVTLAKPEAEGVRVAIHARVGSRNESEALNGASHFIEHMLFKGTPTRSAKALSQAIEGRGGSFNAYTDRDSTCYYATVPYEKQTLALDLLTDMYLNASFDPKELDRERKVIVEEIRMYDDQPDSVAFDRMIAQLWSGHPLGWPILGPADTILSMSREALLGYRARQYAPSRTLFAFAGRVEHEACVAAVERRTAHLRDPAALGEPEPFSRIMPIDPLGVECRRIAQTQLAFGWRIPGTSDLRAAAVFRMLACLLGGSMMSRLFQHLRERRGLCYSVSADAAFYTDCGVLCVTAGCDPTRAYRAARSVTDEMARLADRPVSEAELRRTRDYLCGRFRLRMDGLPIGWAASRILFGLDADPEAQLALFRSVTAADLQAAARMLTREVMTLSVVAPEDGPVPAAKWAAV